MHIIVWEFIVKKGSEERFSTIYGPEGDWAKLFREGKGYLRTELLRDNEHPHRFLTLDFWESKSAFDAFHTLHSMRYAALDDLCSALTDSERCLGTFSLPRS